MTMKHKINELEEKELLQEFNDGYISKSEYESRLKELRKNVRTRPVGTKGFDLFSGTGDYDEQED